MDDKATTPWQVLRQEVLLVRPRFRVIRESVRIPDGRIVEDYDLIEMGRAAVIVASRADGRVILLRTYKHGSKRAGLSFPGGGVEPGESDLVAAQRELREETGYESNEWRSLGEYPVHTNQGCGQVAFFSATHCHYQEKTASDDLEAFDFVFADREEILKSLISGDFVGIGHVALAGLWLAQT